MIIISSGNSRGLLVAKAIQSWLVDENLRNMVYYNFNYGGVVYNNLNNGIWKMFVQIIVQADNKENLKITMTVLKVA